jgi:hypothetical protein
MLCERESAKVFWKISFQPLKIPLIDKKWVTSVDLPRRHLWCQNSNSNLYVGISNKLLPAIWNFLPTKSVRCKTGLFWPDWWKIHHQAIFYSNQLWLITYCFSLTATNFLAHFFCPPQLQVVLCKYSAAKFAKILELADLLSGVVSWHSFCNKTVLGFLLKSSLCWVTGTQKVALCKYKDLRKYRLELRH